MCVYIANNINLESGQILRCVPDVTMTLHTQQEVDGETLVMLHKCEGTEQLSTCGFSTIKKQMKFMKAIMLVLTQRT